MRRPSVGHTSDHRDRQPQGWGREDGHGRQPGGSARRGGELALVVDLDPQGSASSWLGVNEDGAEALEPSPQASPFRSARPPRGGSTSSRAAPRWASAERRLAGEIGAERLLAEALARTEGPWQWVLLDCPRGSASSP